MGSSARTGPATGRIDKANPTQVVHWADGHDSTYHFAWLRHALFFPPFSERKDALERFGSLGGTAGGNRQATKGNQQTGRVNRRSWRRPTAAICA